ncbi:MAG: hypothetical protein ABR987_02615 [Terracidiphilus sp.]
MPDVTTARIRRFLEVHVYTVERLAGQAPNTRIQNSHSVQRRPALAVFDYIQRKQPLGLDWLY